ncbi:MAG: hypothetical protein LQ343_006169 [Gyalolechia ehrenbergii]|nr:MAG: hypothetical protein LQ343_006169 [Gyalolechia ehrenbergii]
MDQPLILGENLSLEPFAQHLPIAASPTILIIGGGVTGLVNAWVLLDRGYRVTIVAKEWASFTDHQRLTSQIAGALWEYPPAVCGQHTDAMSLSRSKRWCMIAYSIWEAIASNPKLAALAGVQMRSSNFFFPFPIEEHSAQYQKMQEIENSGVHGFNRAPNLIHKQGINPRFGAVDAYEHLAPVIDTDRCMEWLMVLTQSKGAKFHTETITDDLFHQEQELLDRFSADVLVNCTGLSALSLAGDKTCYPLRGALIRVLNDGTEFPKVDCSLAITADAAQDNEIVFIVPRNDNILLIGGVAQPHRWELDLTLESPEIQRMRARAEAFLPGLKRARLDDEYPIAQGLRPARERNIRVERELRTRTVSLHGEEIEEPSRIIHSYGHGGSGWSLSFGCAADVVSLVEDVLHNLPASGMKVQERVEMEDVHVQALWNQSLKDGPIRAKL